MSEVPSAVYTIRRGHREHRKCSGDCTAPLRGGRRLSGFLLSGFLLSFIAVSAKTFFCGYDVKMAKIESDSKQELNCVVYPHRLFVSFLCRLRRPMLASRYFYKKLRAPGLAKPQRHHRPWGGRADVFGRWLCVILSFLPQMLFFTFFPCKWGRENGYNVFPYYQVVVVCWCVVVFFLPTLKEAAAETQKSRGFPTSAIGFSAGLALKFCFFCFFSVY